MRYSIATREREGIRLDGSPDRAPVAHSLVEERLFLFTERCG
jgi:hypothetical protein